MAEIEQPYAADIAAIGAIDAVPAILEVVCRTTGMGFAAVARVSEDRWIACAVKDEIAFGLKPGGELKVETTICDEIRDSGKSVIIDEVATDAVYCGHPTPAMYGFQSYISIPIWRADKTFFGTLCAIDPRPAKVNRPEIVAMFQLFAELIGAQLEAQDRAQASAAALARERAARDLREQFIAVLGHDLRNPLAAIGAGVRTLQGDKASAKAPAVLDLMQRSVARMTELIDNVLDLARGRLGRGIPINRSEETALTPYLEQVIAELRATAPERRIEARLTIGVPLNCDSGRIARLLSNLLGNAIAYGAPDRPIRIEAHTSAAAFELFVANEGAPIPADVAARIFQPYVRASGKAGEGLGLGLYIASEIARAHGGTLKVASSAVETRFTFTMPLA